MTDPRLSPHNLAELDLMLAGKKNVSYFFMEIPPEFLIGYKYNREIEFYDFAEDPCVYIFYLVGHRKSAIRLEQLIKEPRKTKELNEAVEREIGEILGYSKEEIDFYIETQKKRYKACS